VEPSSKFQMYANPESWGVPRCVQKFVQAWVARHTPRSKIKGPGRIAWSLQVQREAACAQQKK
jgi:hypothetical protein